MVNNLEELTSINFGQYGAYIMQDEVCFNYFTPKEAIAFAANLKLSLPRNEISDIVDKIVIDCGLWSIKDRQMNSYLTNSEKKRTIIAANLVTNPSLLVLDEPTSGLDSIQALNVVKLLRKQA